MPQRNINIKRSSIGPTNSRGLPAYFNRETKLRWRAQTCEEELNGRFPALKPLAIIGVLLVAVVSILESGSSRLTYSTSQDGATQPVIRPLPTAVLETITDYRSMARLRLLQDDVRKVKQLVTRLAHEHRRWNREVVPLLDNSQGRQIAANPTSLLTFRSLFEKERPLPTEKVQLEIASIEMGVNKTLQEKSASPRVCEHFSGQAETLMSALNRTIRSLVDDREIIVRLSRNARTAASCNLRIAVDRQKALEARIHFEQSLQHTLRP